MLKKLKTRLSNNAYKRKYGKNAFKNKEIAEKMMELILKHKEHLTAHPLNDDSYWEGRIRKYVEDGRIDVGWLFNGTYSLLKKTEDVKLGLSKYQWLNESAVSISLDTLPNMISFQICLSQLLEQATCRYNMIVEMEKNGLETRNHPVLIEFDALIQQNMEELERILNPVTRVFYDESSKETVLNERMNEKLKEFKQKSLLVADASVVQAHQMESIRQLESILSNEDVSSETKEKAKATIQEIEQNIATQEKLRKKEEAELEAHSIIEASLIVHQLKQA